MKITQDDKQNNVHEHTRKIPEIKNCHFIKTNTLVYPVKKKRGV